MAAPNSTCVFPSDIGVGVNGAGMALLSFLLSLISHAFSQTDLRLPHGSHGACLAHPQSPGDRAALSHSRLAACSTHSRVVGFWWWEMATFHLPWLWWMEVLLINSLILFMMSTTIYDCYIISFAYNLLCSSTLFFPKKDKMYHHSFVLTYRLCGFKYNSNCI